MEHWLWMILMGFLHKGSCEESIYPLFYSVQVLEGDSVTLSCNYSEGARNLYWYQQQPRSSPRFLISDFSEKTSHLSTKKDMNRFHLKISSAALPDSALYYCALQPKVTGNTHTLYKNLSRALRNRHEDTSGVRRGGANSRNISV